MRLDLDEPLFQTRDALALVPGLDIKQLQRWGDLRFVDVRDLAPGTGNPRLYSAKNIIALDFLVRTHAMGVATHAAAAMTKPLLEWVDTYWSRHPEERHNGKTSIPIDGLPDRPWDRAMIYRSRKCDCWTFDTHSARSDPMRALLAPPVYVTIELEFLVADALNRMFAKMGATYA